MMDFPGMIEPVSVPETCHDEVEESEYREITITLPGEPMPKQSVRVSVNRRYGNTEGVCPFCNKPTVFKKGDVVVFRNKTTGMADVILKTYQDTHTEKRKEFYRMAIRPQLPKGFTVFTEEVHIVKADFIFAPLASFPKWKKEAISKGEIVYKTTRPDLPDNLKKLAYDAISGVIWQDDGLICSENNIRKIYGATPCIKITIRGK